jgi:hypothetical protein
MLAEGIGGDNRPIALNDWEGRASRSCILFQLEFLQEERLQRRPGSWRVTAGAEPLEETILFIPASVPLDKLATDWAEGCDKIILRRCPVCKQDSIIGHGRRRKQAHDEHHDWIVVRRGRCAGCGMTFTFLPLFSLPYTHFSLLARCQALRQCFVDHCSWEKAVPKLKDADRLPDASTVRRWSSGLDGSQPALSFFRQVLVRVAHWLERGNHAHEKTAPASWITPALAILWPLRV